MARFVLFAKSLCFDADQQKFYPVNYPAQFVALNALQSAVLRRVLTAQGKLVRNQALHLLFQREISEIPFADRLTSTISDINRLALSAGALSVLIHQVPLIGCVLAEQVDVETCNDVEPTVATNVEPEVSASTFSHASSAETKATVVKKRSWWLRGVLAAVLLLNIGAAWLVSSEFTPVKHQGTHYSFLRQEGQTQVFMAEGLSANSFVVLDALRRFRTLKPHMKDGSIPPLMYINRTRTRVFTSTFLCAQPFLQRQNDCMAWMVSQQESPNE
ncbi:hypothetical protein [Pantoea sp.]|uniref:hypothetical protein n=1 Tax=Pantoea sp. TaxID=69393 RepID=UPI0031D408CC